MYIQGFPTLVTATILGFRFQPRSADLRHPHGDLFYE
jgi:hypothetical protein